MKTKRAFLWATTLLLALICVMLLPTEAKAGELGDLYYEISNGEVTITGCGVFASGEIVIPDTIEGYPVVKIGDVAFALCFYLKSVTIPEGVTTIGEQAFERCENLVSVSIPDSVATIGVAAFRGCKKLQSVTIPDNLTTIGWSMFENCRSLESITLHDGIILNDSSAFSNCTSLTGIWVSDSHPLYRNDSFGVLFNKDKTEIIDVPCGISGHYTIPDSITVIKDYEFSGCVNLTSITIPDHVTSLGESAFENCDGLTSVTIPGSIRSLGDSVFRGCDGLISAVFEEGITYIGWEMFYYCDNLRWVVIPESVVSIEPYAFYFRSDGKFHHVLYKGTQEEWNNSVKTTNNEKLRGAIRHYEYTGDEMQNGVCTICDEDHVHQWGRSEVVKPASCKEDGVKETTCSVCNKVKTEPIYKLTVHTPGPAATATTDQTCTVCGIVLNKATGEEETTAPSTQATEPSTQATEPSTQATEPPTEATTEPTTEPSTEPPTTAPAIPDTEPTHSEPPANNTEISTQPSGTDSPTQPEATSAPPAGSVGGKADADGKIWIIVAAGTALLGGGAAAGVVLWKKKH